MGDYTDSPAQPADSIPTTSAVPSGSVSNLPADSTEASSSTQAKSVDSQVQPSQSELQPNQVLEASASADLIPPDDLPATASASAGSQPVVPTTPVASDIPIQSVPPIQVEPQPAPVSMPPEVSKGGGIQDHSPSNQPSQVQPEMPESTPVVQAENTPSQSAGINPEPLEGIQNTIPADPKPPESPKSSFDDFVKPPVPVVSQSQSNPTPTPPQVTHPVQTPAPASSFGDLMEKLSDLSEEPAIHIDSIEAPPVSSSPAQPVDVPTTQPPDDKQTVLKLGRQRSVDERKQNREENLTKILELAQKKGKIDNLDVRDFLHISQTTATDYLRTLVNSGKLKKEGKAKATTYSL